MTSPPPVTFSASGKVATVTVAGDLDLQSVPALREALLRATQRTPEVLLVDLTGVPFCDSTGMGVLATAAKRMTALGGRLVLSGVQPLPRRVFDLTGLSSAVEVHPVEAGDLHASLEVEVGSRPTP